MIRAILKGVLVVTVVSIYAADAAQPPAQHNKAWYLAHDGERNSTLRLCHSDASYANLYDCQNAEAAGGIADRRQPGPGAGRPADFMLSPSYWARNDVARSVMLGMCATRGRGAPGAYPPYCDAATAGQHWASTAQ